MGSLGSASRNRFPEGVNDHADEDDEERPEDRSREEELDLEDRLERRRDEDREEAASRPQGGEEARHGEASEPQGEARMTARPSLGRMVRFTESDPTLRDALVVYPAVVSRVYPHNEELVDLVVFGRKVDAKPAGTNSWTYRIEGASPVSTVSQAAREGEVEMSWAWPPLL